MMRMLKKLWRGSSRARRGAVTVEYLLLLTLIGIGAIVGLAGVRNALIFELNDVAQAIYAIHGTAPAPCTIETVPPGSGG